jgi:lipopolysaccharide/colanic/teichoic acid biosynthesis glycosyltransferase
MSASFTTADPPSGHYRSRPLPPTTPDSGPDRGADRPGFEALKVAADLLLGAVLLVVFLPVMLVAAAAVRLTSSGPAFYSQQRVGRGGRVFRIYKLRTMYHNCEQKSGAVWSTPGDTRITPLGAILRKTHVDELPQLLNVLRLEMSLVGPRPERPEIIPLLEREIPNYRARLRVRPGVTGLAQLRLPADTNIQSVRRKLAYDLHYIQVRGLWLDLRLVVCTALKMFGASLCGALLQALRVPGDAAVGPADENHDRPQGGCP